MSDSPKHKKAKTLSDTTTHTSILASGSSGGWEDKNRDDTSNWTKVDRRKQKKAKKIEIKNDTTQPRFMYSNAEIVKRNSAIGIEEIRDVILHIIADAPPPNWLRIDNAPLIQKVVALLIPGLTPDILSLPALPTSATKNPNIPLAIPLPPKPENEPGSSSPVPDTASVPFIASTFSHACPTRAPGDQTRMHSVLSTFFSVPVSGEERKKRLARQAVSELSKDDPMRYVMPLEQMIENDYPIPSYMADIFEKPPGWVETPQPGSGDDAIEMATGDPVRKVYAIDCEMCLTEDGKELTRVCIIDYHSGVVVYDKLVKPSKPITDYLTRWSGITAEALNTVNTTLSQVQAHVLRLLSPPIANPFVPQKSATPHKTPILLGHSLESDLKALKICHPLCIDTAIIYHHPRGRPLKPGLAWLTKKWCGREIQTRGEGGHDPEEDARACLDLLKKKIDNGPGFGVFKVDFESIFERMARSHRRAGGGVGSIKTAVVDIGNPAVMHGSKATTTVGCTSDEEVLKGLLDVLPSHHFIFGRFMALAEISGWTTPKATPDKPPPPPTPSAAPEVLARVAHTLNKQLQTLHAALPPRTAIVIFTGHSDPRRMSVLNARKTAFENAIRSGRVGEEVKEGGERWTAADARDLEETVELARRGLLFLGVK